MLDTFNKFKETSPFGWSLYIILHNCVNWNSETLILSLKNSNFSDIAYCQSGKTIRSIWKFDRPSCSSCRLCIALILDPATKTNYFQCNQIVFFTKSILKRFQRTFYEPPLLKLLSAHSRILIKSLVFFFKKWTILWLRCWTIYTFCFCFVIPVISNICPCIYRWLWTNE